MWYSFLILGVGSVVEIFMQSTSLSNKLTVKILDPFMQQISYEK
jgi:hypothetical protein